MAPILKWRQSYDEPFGKIEAVVGCELHFTARAADVSCKDDEDCFDGTAGSGNYNVDIRYKGELPTVPCSKGVATHP